MTIREAFASLAQLSATTGICALAIVCWPVLASSQTLPGLPTAGGLAFDASPSAASAAGGQQETLVQLTNSAKRLMKKWDELTKAGKVESVPAAELPQLTLRDTVRFRVGMFVEYVTPNMGKLFAMFRNAQACTTEFRDLARTVEQEQLQLGIVPRERGKTLGLGPKALTKTCP